MSDDTVVRERGLQPDDAKLVAELIKNHWSLGPQNTPNIEQIPEQFMVDGRVGNIYVYVTNRTNKPASIDYQVLERRTDLAIRISNRFRENHFKWCEEVQRILMAYRRAGQCRLGEYLYMEVLNDRSATDLSGWYTTTLDVRMTTYNLPLRSAGISDSINKQIDDLVNN